MPEGVQVRQRKSAPGAEAAPGVRWQGEPAQEDFNYFTLTGDLSEDQVKQLLGALKAEMVTLARASKAVLSHDPKDSIVDRPMRLLQPALIAA